ncbi:mitochondrial inner membrane protease ATP23 homolog [Diabrotica undecimpunctata]|uniref:mitochondrial inner membrane protease ATP23 homolog n=1 Tax=Diabrotica undecimpunctata TaxID=50387 RepID=UPI003B63435E
MTLVGDFEEKSEKNVKSQQNQAGTIPPDASQWGYDLYPSRKSHNESGSITDYLKGKGKENIDKIHCERNVYKCIKESPMVKLMMGALKASGCTVDIRRHISCEECAPTVSGGYDPIMNQVVICQNSATKVGAVNTILTHEMIHMFDYCKNNVDFKNLEHLACTEIRAANLAHCSFLSAFVAGDASFFDIKEAHQYCVRNKALSSVMAARNVSKEEAMIAIDKVFSKCYADLEPVGRRIRRNSNDMFKAYEEGQYYGYG